MTNKKGTKRSLLMSALAMLLCISMLIGSTFAWFTDSVVSAGNIIKSGTLNIEMLWADGTEDPDAAATVWTDASTGAIFNYDQWEPGYTEVRHIKIANTGTLALKYQLNILPTGEVTDLADVIDVYYLDPAEKLGERAAIAEENKLGTLTEVLAGMADTASGKLLPKEGDVVTIALKMQESAGNDYQDKYIGSSFAIQLLATQLTYEDDSFDDLYDENATMGTYIELEAGADLLAAMASAQADMPLTIKLNGDVEWPTEGHHGENDITPASSILIDGNGYTITATGSGVTPLGDAEAPMTLKNVKIVDNSVSYKESAWELSYLEMGGNVLNCVNVDFADPISVDSETATFTGCSFVGHYDKNSTSTTQYGVWVANGDSTFTNCTFTGTRGMKICDQYAPEVGTVVVDGCTFNGISEKPGVVIDNRGEGDVSSTEGMTVIIKNSTFINCKAGDQSMYIYETDNVVPTLENNTVLNGNEIAEGLYYEAGNKTFTVASKAGLMNLGEELVKVSPNEANIQTVNLACDVDLAGETWAPLTSMWVNFNGNGHTISNLTAGFDSTGRRSGFWGYAGAVSINDLTLHNVSVAGSQVGTFAGSAEGLRMNNCVLSGTNTVTYVDGVEDWNGVGAITGTLTNSTINATIAEGATVQLIKAGFVTDSGCKFQDNLTGYIQANAGTVTNNGTVQVVDLTIATADELFAFAKDVNENGNKYSGKTVVLTADIDLENKAWTPIGQTGAPEFRGVFDGQNYTIKNLSVDNTAYDDEHTSTGLFGWAESGVTIKNVKVDGATVKGNHNVAVIVGYTYSGKIINCHVSNATVVCKHANGEACGDKAGTIAGYTADEARLSGCTASASTVTAGRDAGQLFGLAYTNSVSNCSATDVVVSAGGDCNREGNINNAVIGRVMG